jgi:hypothetical protein
MTKQPYSLAYYKTLRAHGYTAEQALASARRHESFRKRLSEDVKAYKKRSAAAKKAWKTRKDAA